MATSAVQTSPRGEGAMEGAMEDEVQVNLHPRKNPLHTRYGSRKKFVAGAEAEVIEGSSSMTRGTVTLDEYKKLLEANERVEQLRQFGLTDDEIALKLDSEKKETVDSNTNEPPATKRACTQADHSAQVSQLCEIDEKIAEYQRRVKDGIECTVPRDTVNNRAERNMTEVVDPINNLADIWKEIQERSWRSTNGEGKRSRRRRRKLEKKQALEEYVDESVNECNDYDSPWIGCLTRDEMIERDPLYLSNKLNKERRLQEAQEFTPPSLEASVESHQCLTVEEIPADVIERYRLNPAQIRELPRFLDYNPGIPSQILYLKNMSARVTREDLVSIFGRYEKPNELPITYKLFRGRMRGQAFIEFPSVATATSALELVNGYDFRGRHIIIEYGKKMTGEPNTNEINFV